MWPYFPAIDCDSKNMKMFENFRTETGISSRLRVKKLFSDNQLGKAQRYKLEKSLEFARAYGGGKPQTHQHALEGVSKVTIDCADGSRWEMDLDNTAITVTDSRIMICGQTKSPLIGSAAEILSSWSNTLKLRGVQNPCSEVDMEGRAITYEKHSMTPRELFDWGEPDSIECQEIVAAMRKEGFKLYDLPLINESNKVLQRHAVVRAWATRFGANVVMPVYMDKRQKPKNFETALTDEPVAMNTDSEGHLDCDPFAVVLNKKGAETGRSQCVEPNHTATEERDPADLHYKITYYKSVLAERVRMLQHSDSCFTPPLILESGIVVNEECAKTVQAWAIAFPGRKIPVRVKRESYGGTNPTVEVAL